MLNTLLSLQHFVGDKPQTNTCYKQGLAEDGNNDYDASLISTKHKNVNIIMNRWEKHLFVFTPYHISSSKTLLAIFWCYIYFSKVHWLSSIIKHWCFTQKLSFYITLSDIYVIFLWFFFKYPIFFVNNDCY